MRDLADNTSQKLQDIWVDMETNPQKDHKGITLVPRLYPCCDVNCLADEKVRNSIHVYIRGLFDKFVDNRDKTKTLR